MDLENIGDNISTPKGIFQPQPMLVPKSLATGDYITPQDFNSRKPIPLKQRLGVWKKL